MADQQKIVLELEAKTKKLVAELKKAKKSIKGVDDQTNRMRISTAGLRRSIGALRNNMLLVSFAFGGTAKAVSSLIRAYGEQELAERNEVEKRLAQLIGSRELENKSGTVIEDKSESITVNDLLKSGSREKVGKKK